MPVDARSIRCHCGHPSWKHGARLACQGSRVSKSGKLVECTCMQYRPETGSRRYKDATNFTLVQANAQHAKRARGEES